jgi:hypothetical protein
MPKMTVEIRTDENGYFSKTIRYNAPGPIGMSVSLSGVLVSPVATGLWGDLDIDAADGAPSNAKRPFVAWHGEVVYFGSWVLDGGDNIIVVNGKTKPRRPYTRLVLEIDAAV